MISVSCRAYVFDLIAHLSQMFDGDYVPRRSVVGSMSHMGSQDFHSACMMQVE